MRRLGIAVLSAAVLTAAAALAATTPQAVNTACAPGETGVTNGCAPFCLPGRYFDYNRTGLCLPVTPPPPPPPNDPVPQSVPM
jgi:hypothetical protein